MNDALDDKALIGQPYVAVIRENATGEEREWDRGSLKWFDAAAYWWLEGNMACDCNRCAAFEKECACGESAYTLVRFKFPGIGRTIEVDDTMR